jgi:hypothetical protein
VYRSPHNADSHHELSLRHIHLSRALLRDRPTVSSIFIATPWTSLTQAHPVSRLVNLALSLTIYWSPYVGDRPRCGERPLILRQLRESCQISFRHKFWIDECHTLMLKSVWPGKSSSKRFCSLSLVVYRVCSSWVMPLGCFFFDGIRNDVRWGLLEGVARFRLESALLKKIRVS